MLHLLDTSVNPTSLALSVHWSIESPTRLIKKSLLSTGTMLNFSLSVDSFSPSRNGQTGQGERAGSQRDRYALVCACLISIYMQIHTHAERERMLPQAAAREQKKKKFLRVQRFAGD